MTLGVARDISLIILICPLLICLLAPAAIVFGSWWVMRRTRRALPPRFQQARGLIRRTRDGLDGATRAFSAPIFFFETQAARMRAMRRSLRRPHLEK